MKGTAERWPDGRRRCDGISETEGRRCFDVGRVEIAGDVAALVYCPRHGRVQARAMRRHLQIVAG